MKKGLIIIPIVLIVGAGFFFFSKSKTKTVEVEEVQIEQIEVVKTISASGNAKSESELDLAFALGGRISDLRVKKGDKVNKDQLLATAISTSDYNDIQSLRDSRDIAEREKDIYVETYGDNISAVGENEYRANLRKYDEVISKTQASYESALNSLNKLQISSPVAGTVVDVMYEQDEVALIGQTVFKVANLDSILFNVQVDQEDFGFLKVGQKVDISFDSYPDVTITGSIEKLPLFANSNGDFEVDILLDKSQKVQILLGMTGDAEIKIDSTGKKVQALSFDALSEDEKGTFVWVDDNGILAKKYIKTGLEGDFYTEVVTDLSGQKIVIPTEDVELEEGQKVKYAKSN